jgi:hypothetical protein
LVIARKEKDISMERARRKTLRKIIDYIINEISKKKKNSFLMTPSFPSPWAVTIRTWSRWN